MSNNVDQYILQGPEILYEPTRGGLGYEIFKALSSNKGKIAQNIISSGETDTYEDLLERSLKISIYLSNTELSSTDTVCLLSENSLNSVVPFIAAQFVGLKYVSIEPTIPEDDLVYLFTYLQPRIIFVSEKFEEKVDICATESNSKLEIIVLGRSMKFIEFSQLLEMSTEENNFQPVFIENIKKEAAIFLTSGTTGRPKGICVSHYALLGQMLNFYICSGRGSIHLSNFSMKVDDTDTFKIMYYSPMNWISCTMSFLMMFFAGGTIILGTDFEAEEAWQALEKYKPNSIFLPPGQVNELCSYGYDKKPITTLDLFGTGGGLVSKMHIENINKCFPQTIACQAYGQTENVGAIATFNIHNPDDLEMTRNHPESCGKATSGIQFRVVDRDHGTICGVGMMGELRVRNKFMMNGYYKMDSSSAFDSDGWFKTGDLAYFDENHCIYIVDRIKDQLLYTLYNIRPSVIEKILDQHPAVQESLIIGFPHPEDNEHPMGVVVLKNEFKNEISQEEIIAFVNERVPSDRYKIRAGVKFVDKLLKTASGKLKKLEMKKLAIAEKL